MRTGRDVGNVYTIVPNFYLGLAIEGDLGVRIVVIDMQMIRGIADYNRVYTLGANRSADDWDGAWRRGEGKRSICLRPRKFKLVRSRCEMVGGPLRTIEFEGLVIQQNLPCAGV